MMAADHDITQAQDGAAVAAAAIGRRAAPRLRLAIPARFISVTATQGCILLDISRSGARIALASPAPFRQSGYIEIGRFELFGMVVRSERLGDGGINAVAFDEPMSEAEVLAIRSFAEVFEQRERQSLRDQVRRWVTGER
ncbi:PilZ domain-containing protein [Erythrobacter sp. CCH5-A1]|jgi:hypothetical protein|uniref:PilZ domain-containing protein n=1 Tax=Erythrobacter sp. CCH5-A1 TaxID=1768792 RepID=UPI000836F804|nr:PilZ domain-containing protein [Erythrobacter sp. CCH5-A1]